MSGRSGCASLPPAKASYSRLRQRLMAILVKDEGAYAALAERLRAALTRAWGVGVEEAFQAALQRLRGMDPARFTAADEQRLLAAIEASIGGEAMRTAMEGPVLTLSEAIYRVGAQEGARPAGVDYAFGLRDERALALINRFDLHWIGRHWDAGTRATVSEAVRAFFAQGWSYETLAERLEEAFAGVEERGIAYWQLTADTIATKSRELGRVGGYEQAGVGYVEVRAHIDARTTPICRSMHGRLIPLARLVAQRERYLAAIERGNMLEAKHTWPMFEADTRFAEGTRVLPDNVGLPPYHFRCRTITVAYLGEAPERFALRFGEGVPAAERAQIEAFSAAEHGRRAETFRQQAAEEGLAWDEAHLRQDVRKAAVEVLRHARREFGLVGTDEAASKAYVRLSQRVVELGERLAVQAHRGRLQYVFGASALGAVAIVDWERAALVGLYGHRKSPEAFDRAWAARYAHAGAQIVRQEDKSWNPLIRWRRWR